MSPVCEIMANFMNKQLNTRKLSIKALNARMTMKLLTTVIVLNELY